jgi:hypothetical protein
MTHLNSALLMGAALRQEVKPRLSARGVTFSNVLFVTEASLEEAELKAASFFWSINRVKLPAVNENRLRTVSEHLIDSVAPEHVFLKVEAWKMHARLSVIADLDMLMLNPDALCQCLHDFLPEGRHGDALTTAGSAVMQRMNSKVDFEAAPIVKQSGQRSQPRGGKASYVPTLSYCFALIQPTQKSTRQPWHKVEQRKVS